jgi:hypothetical protein
MQGLDAAELYVRKRISWDTLPSCVPSAAGCSRRHRESISLLPMAQMLSLARGPRPRHRRAGGVKRDPYASVATLVIFVFYSTGGRRHVAVNCYIRIGKFDHDRDRNESGMTELIIDSVKLKFHDGNDA